MYMLREGVKSWSVQPLPQDFFPGEKLITVETVCNGKHIRFADAAAIGYAEPVIERLNENIDTFYRNARIAPENF